MIVFSMDQNRKMKRAFKKQRVQIGELNSRLEDSLLGVRVVKAFANEEIEAEKARKASEKERKQPMTTVEKKRIGAIIIASIFSIIFWIFWYLGYLPVYYYWA